MKKTFFMIPAVFLLFSCAMLEIPEDKKPLSQRIYSYDAEIKRTALDEFSGLDENARNKVLLSSASMLCREKDTDTQVRILKTLTELKCPPDAVSKVLECAYENGEMKIYNYLRTFFYSGPAVDKSQVAFLSDMLKKDDWRIKEFALILLGRIGIEAYSAVPDIVVLMKNRDITFERFSMCFDAIARIHPQTAVDIIILMITEQSETVRQNAVRKLIELEVYMSKSIESMKEVLPAILRVISSGDEKLKTFVKDAVAGIKDQETQKKIKEYIEATGKLAGGILRILGSGVNEKLNEQENRIKMRMKKMYEDNGIGGRLLEIGVE